MGTTLQLCRRVGHAHEFVRVIEAELRTVQRRRRKI